VWLKKMFKREYIILVGLLVCLVGCAKSQQDSLDTPTRELPDMIYAALAKGQTTIKIPPGRYYVAPRNGTHLRLENIQGVTIDATGVEMVCSETTRAILIEDCQDLAIIGLTIDYDPLPFTQGTIVDISTDRKSHTIRITDGFPAADSAMVFKHMIFTPEGDLRFGHYYAMELEILPDNHLRIFGLHPEKDGGEQVGDQVVISSESLKGRYDPHAVHIYNSIRTRLEDVTLYASPCFGFFGEHSSETVYINCKIDRRAGRLLSLNADAFHSKFAKIGPQINNCSAMWMGDDGVNICGAYHLVTGAEGRKLRVLAKREMDIEVGDPVQLMTVEGHALPPANVVAMKKVGQQNAADREKIAPLPLLSNVVDLLKVAYEIELDTEVDLVAGGVISSMNRMGNGFAVTDSTFGNIRSRGILVKAGDGIISGNTMINCHLQGIKISPEYLWLESGFSQGLRVLKNTIIDSKAESILVDSVGPFLVHQDIDIMDNEIRSDSYPLIRIRGLDGGTLRGNQIKNSKGQRAPKSTVDIQYSEGIRR
jgi:hypothetical protein